jgi:pimeloyl-ACP methyl ester carboxylesterase
MKIITRAFFQLILCVLCHSAFAQLPPSTNGKFVKVNGQNIYYEESGSGQPLLLLHGFGRTLEDWKPFMTDLAKSHRVIAIDLPGHGRSDLMDSTETYLHKQAATQVMGLIGALKLDSLSVIGFSSGAFITLYLATMKPELAKKIIVVAGQLYYSEGTRNFISSLGGPDNFVTDPKEYSQLHGTVKGNLVARQFWNFRKLYGDPSFTPDVLASIKAKTLIVHGDDDPAAPVENAFTMFRHIPDAHLWVLPYAEHIGFFLPENQQEFLRQTKAFLSRK